ncbi:mediator of RNA polymerase II transcription subunit 16 [Medicago truncatula]|uniref:Mediator of RNA polymerase II transcription subunit 16 n=1 Tax=Medicago truncatula TaxID=3880 RepID=G7JI28_MEDTR|nr:mediator of RNA polymerase II transcription subunit 16 [Medicago truncatula]
MFIIVGLLWSKSSVNPRFWIPIQIVIPERPTEIAAFNVVAGTLMSWLFHNYCSIQWSPVCCPRALLIANFQGRVTIWTQPSQCLYLPLFSIHGPTNIVIDTNCWQCEHEWRQDTAVVTKWLSGASPMAQFSLCLFCITIRIGSTSLVPKASYS